MLSMVPGARFVDVAYAVAGYPLDSPAGGTAIINASSEEAAFNATNVVLKIISVNPYPNSCGAPTNGAPTGMRGLIVQPGKRCNVSFGF